MESNSHAVPSSLFPAVLAKPFVALGLAVALPSLLAAASRVLGFWCVFGEMPKMSVIWACSLVAAFLVPALLALLAWPFCRRRGAVPGWFSVLLGLLAVGILYYFTFTGDKVFPSSMRVPDWVLGVDWLFLPFICFTPAIFLGLWRLAGFATHFRPIVDFFISAACAFIVPLVGYTCCTAFAALMSNVGSRSSGKVPERLAWMLLAVVLIAVSLAGFLAFFRAVLIAIRAIRDRTAESAVCRRVALALVAFVLPLAGLALNSKIPFPADFQFAVFYAFPFTVTLALFIPADTRFRAVNALGAVLRLILFPVTIYFFVVFLPFLPFALFAILAMGLGFLILSPALLFFFHAAAVRDDFVRLAACGRGRAVLVTVLGCLVLPAAFAVHTEIDRARLHALLDFVDRSPASANVVSPVSRESAVKILNAARGFKEGSIVPYLDSWYNYRVFDNLLLPDARWCTLWNLFTGEDVKPPKGGDFSFNREFGNAFASLFGRGRTVDTTAGKYFGYGATPRAAHLKDYSVAPAVTTGNVTTVAVTLNVAANDGIVRNQEYAARLDVPAGVFVTNFELLIDTNWVAGRIIEKKAAEWVYRQIVTERRDPSILRYGDDGRLELRVFPVPFHGVRSVRITFLYPQGLADSIGVVETKSGIASTTRIPFGTPLVRPFLFKHAEADIPARGDAPATNRPAARFVPVFDCSVSNVWTEAAVSNALAECKAAHPAAGFPAWAAVNYEFRYRMIQELSGSAGPRQEKSSIGAVINPTVSDIVASLLPPRGGFNAARVAWTLSPYCDDSDDAPEICYVAAPGLPPELARSHREALSAAVARRRSCQHHYPRLFRPANPAGNAEGRLDGVLHAWALWAAQDADPSLDLRKEILAASRAARVLTPAAAFIVVENSMQSKMLDVKQRETLHGSDSFDLTESDTGDHSSTSPEPSLAILVFLLLVTLLLRRDISVQVPRL